MSADEVAECTKKFVEELKAAMSEGRPSSLPVRRLVSLDPLLNAAANGDVADARCGDAAAPAWPAALR